MKVKNKGRMYENTKTWNPFVGCEHDCEYCKYSFQSLVARLAKMRNSSCLRDSNNCLNYRPHYHPERLHKIPTSSIIFVCGNGDITFCNPNYVENKIILAIKEHIEVNLPRAKKYSNKQFYLQSKNPICLKQYIDDFMPIAKHVIFVTTLETNRDVRYRRISKAPLPSKRYRDFLSLNYPRKVVTIEPIMDFDSNIFLNWILSVKNTQQLEYVWIGYNSRPKHIQLPEPSETKLKDFIISLWNNNIQVKPKDLRGLTQWFDMNSPF